MLSAALVFACLARAALAAPLALDAADLSAPGLFVAGDLPGIHHRGSKLNMTIADMEARILYLEARAQEKFKVESGAAYSVRAPVSFARSVTQTLQAIKAKQTKHRVVGVAEQSPTPVLPISTSAPVPTATSYPVTNFLQDLPADVTTLVTSAQKTGCVYQIDTKPNPGYTENGDGGKSE